MPDTVEELKKELEYYHRLFGIGEYDPAKKGYMVLVHQLRQRNEFIDGFKINEKIGNAVKDDPVYARATDLIDSLPKMISSVNSLKLELGIEYNPEDAKERTGATTPQSLMKRD